MEIARKPTVQVIWNKKNVTAKIAEYISQIKYSDHEEAAADELTLTLDNTSAIWSEDWYPAEGDTLQLYIGYEDSQIDSGLFEVDEITLSGMPDQIEIKAISAGITKDLRTRNNKLFAGQTLKEVAQFFCKKHGFSLIDGSNMLNQINLDQKTQENKTDLAFLSELAKEYGFLFTIKGDKMVFTSYYDLDNVDSVAEIDKTQISSYSLTEKTYDTYAGGDIKKRNPKKGKIVKYSTSGNILDTSKTDREIFQGTTSYVSSPSQAEAKVKGGLWNKNKFKQSGTLSIEGNPLLVAGQNFDLTGFGLGSGKYHITQSEHTIDASGGYTTSLDIRKTGTLPKPKRVPRISSSAPKQSTADDVDYDQIDQQEVEDYSDNTASDDGGFLDGIFGF